MRLKFISSTSFFQVLLHELWDWLKSTPISIIVCILLIDWFLLFPYIAGLIGSKEYIYYFVAKAYPSPGWIFAGLTHSGLRHLLSNVVAILLFGGICERFLDSKRYAILLIGGNICGTLVQVSQYLIHSSEGGAVGASGAALAVIAFSVTIIVVDSEEKPIEDALMAKFLALSGIALISLQMMNDFTYLLNMTANSSGEAHLTGIVIGIGSALYSVR